MTDKQLLNLVQMISVLAQQNATTLSMVTSDNTVLYNSAQATNKSAIDTINELAKEMFAETTPENEPQE